MSSHRSVGFHYIKMPNDNRKFFCLEQNILVLAWILFFINDSLTPIEQVASKISRGRLFLKQMRGYPGLIKKNVRLLTTFIGFKFQWLKREGIVSLPCYGQVCVPAHKGYKVFDYYRGVVTKVFDHDVDSSLIRNEIEMLQLVSPMGFSSSLIKMNIEEKWYQEEYLNGSLDASYKPMDSGTLLKKFFNEIVQHLTSLMLFQKPVLKQSVEYVRDITRTLRFKMASRQAAPEAELQEISSFVDSIVNRLQAEGNSPIFLVFAHGDFVPANMLNVKHGVRVIDWEDAGPKSALFDFYSYFFNRPACRNVPVDVLVSEIHEALPRVISVLTKKDSEISRSLKTSEKSYRWTFYIEMICRLVDREMTDKNLNIMHYIREYIKAFNLYEELHAGAGQ